MSVRVSHYPHPHSAALVLHLNLRHAQPLRPIALSSRSSHPIPVFASTVKTSRRTHVDWAHQGLELGIPRPRVDSDNDVQSPARSSAQLDRPLTQRCRIATSQADEDITDDDLGNPGGTKTRKPENPKTPAQRDTAVPHPGPKTRKPENQGSEANTLEAKTKPVYGKPVQNRPKP